MCGRVLSSRSRVSMVADREVRVTNCKKDASVISKGWRLGAAVLADV